MTNVNAPGQIAGAALACLKRSLAFGELDLGQLAILAGRARAKTVRAGQCVFAEGDPARAFFAVDDGELHLFRVSPIGGEKVFQILGADDLLAEAAMFLDPPVYPMTARAIRDSHLYVLPREALHALCDASPSFMRSLLGALSKRLHHAMDRIDHLTLNNAGQRLVVYLLDLRGRHKGNWIDIPVSFVMLAGQLGMTPETLSRLLQKFRQGGMISGNGRTLVLLDAEALCDSVDLPRSGIGVTHGGGDGSMVGCCNLGLGKPG